MSYKYGQNGKMKKSRDEKLKNKRLEANNYSKMLKNLKEEHEKVKTRVFQVQDHKYLINLRKEVKETKEYIAEVSTQ